MTDESGRTPSEVLFETLEEVKSLKAAAETLASKEYVEKGVLLEGQRRRKLAYLVMLVGAAFTIVLLVLLIGLIKINSLAEENKHNTTQTVSNTSIIADCLKPSTDTEVHPCFEARVRRFNKQLDDANSRLLLEILQIAKVPTAGLPPEIQKRLKELGSLNSSSEFTN